MTTGDLLAPTVNVYAEPGDLVTIEVNVPASLESGTWTGYLWEGTGCQGAPVALFDVTPPSSSPVILKLDTTGLVPAWAKNFTGHWELDRTSAGETRTWVKGDFVLDTSRRQMGA